MQGVLGLPITTMIFFKIRTALIFRSYSYLYSDRYCFSASIVLVIVSENGMEYYFSYQINMRRIRNMYRFCNVDVSQFYGLVLSPFFLRT